MLMEKLLNYFSEHFKYFCKVYVKPEYSIERVLSLSVDSTQYIDIKIADEIKSKLRKQIRIQFDDSIDLTIYFSEAKPKYYLDFIIFYTKWILYILKKMKGHQPELSIKLFLTGFKKRFPNGRKQDLTPYNVNSGVTYYYKFSNHRNVIIFREEELLKVLMHEMIHAYKLDSTDMDVGLESKIRDYFGRKSKIYLNESYTDTLACLYNVLCFSLIWSHITGRNLRQSFYMFLDRERSYILAKARDVLLHEGFEFDKNGLINVVSKDEKTHVISYYVLKAVNFCFIDSFIRFLIPNNIDMKDDKGYSDLVYNNLRNSEFWKKICEHRTRHSSSLRMSEVDIKILIIMAKDKLLKTLLS